MEKKTIGSFIAALRRASGMTQRELAEKLYVSDKTVSRWECDESTPELSLIPVIADIFGVTADELLRGERKSPDSANLPLEFGNTEVSNKGEKSFKILLRKRLEIFKMQSWISIGLAFLGLFIALICNFGFLRAIIGFCIGSCFVLASVICQICFINLKYFRNDDEMFFELVSDFNYSVYKISRKVFLVILTVFCFILPFLIEYAYVGLSSESWLLIGICFSAVLTLFSVIFSETFIFKKLVKSGIIAPANTDIEICNKKITFLKKRSPICIGIAAALCVVIGIVVNLPHFIAKPIIFDNYESFKNYIEMPINYYEYENGDVVVEHFPVFDANVSEEIPDDKFIDDDYAYYDEIEITDENGNVLCSFRHKNRNVARFTLSDSHDRLPIKVYTYEAWNNAQETCGIICAFLAIGIGADILCFVFAYFKCNKKTYRKQTKS